MPTRVKAKPYYASGSLSARFYDVVTAADSTLPGDESIYASLVRANGSVLELGAGTGRLTASLATRGLSVTGVDLARPMLVQAQDRVAALPAELARRVELRQGDMTSLDLRRRFDLVVCPFFTLAHVPVGAAWRNSFATFARHLEPDGRVAVHLPIGEIMRGPGPTVSSRPVMDQPLADGARLQLYVLERSYRADLGRLEQVIEYVVVDRAGRAVERSPERLTYFVADPEPFARAAGLAVDRPPIEHGGVGEVWVFRRA